jgi:acyl carrier protein
MENDTLKERVTRVIADVIEKPVEVIDLDARLVEDYGIDSLLALEILAVMEKEFQLEIPEEELPNFSTTRKVIEMIERKMGVNVA